MKLPNLQTLKNHKRKLVIGFLGLLSGSIHTYKFVEFWNNAPVKESFTYLLDGSKAIKFSNWRFTRTQIAANFLLLSLISTFFIWIVTRIIEQLRDRNKTT